MVTKLGTPETLKTMELYECNNLWDVWNYLLMKSGNMKTFVLYRADIHESFMIAFKFLGCFSG